jgi:MFS family permease
MKLRTLATIFGQLVFGFLGDALGRKFVYSKEPIVFIIGTILVISMSNSIPTSTLKMIWIFCFRALMGVGIGRISGKEIILKSLRRRVSVVVSMSG